MCWILFYEAFLRNAGPRGPKHSMQIMYKNNELKDWVDAPGFCHWPQTLLLGGVVIKDLPPWNGLPCEAWYQYIHTDQAVTSREHLQLNLLVRIQQNIGQGGSLEGR